VIRGVSGALRSPDEKSFGRPDVAEPIHVFVLDHFADELRAALAEPGEARGSCRLTMRAIWAHY
jgi:hypothetical protein